MAWRTASCAASPCSSPSISGPMMNRWLSHTRVIAASSASRSGRYCASRSSSGTGTPDIPRGRHTVFSADSLRNPAWRRWHAPARANARSVTSGRCGLFAFEFGELDEPQYAIDGCRSNPAATIAPAGDAARLARRMSSRRRTAAASPGPSGWAAVRGWRLRQDPLRDDRAAVRLVQPSEPVHHRLGHVGDDGEAARHVAVEGAVADRELRLVRWSATARRACWRAPSAGSSNARLMFSSVTSRAVRRTRRAACRPSRASPARSAASACRCPGSVRARANRRCSRGSSTATASAREDARGPDGVGGNGGGERRVDAAESPSTTFVNPHLRA